MDSFALSAKVKRLRKTTGLSLQEVADRAGCSKTHVWEIETGRFVNPTLKTIAGFARAFGCSLSEFIEEWEPRSMEFAVCVGSDAMRIALGMAPVTVSHDDVIRWLEAQKP